MAKVACSADGCVYNRNDKCHKRQINIIGIKADKADDTECINFTKGNSNLYLNEMAEFDQTNSSTSISCTASNCTYNKKYYCTKDNVKVFGKSATYTEDTFCDSFYEEKSL